MDIPSLYQKFLQSGKISTDTRQITSGAVFFALKGPSFNANAFADEALEKGASYAVIDDVAFQKDDRYLVAEDSLDALQALARYHREQLSIPVIGLTGSNGKTTSKELLQAVLSRKFKTLATRGNLNNHIGVPLTILSITSSVEIAVVEMGANHLGEIAALCTIAKPTHGFITNIGRAHIGTFGGAENILRAKSELYQYLISSGGVVFINSQNATLKNMARRFKDPVFYPEKGDYYHCELIDADPWVRIRAENGETITTQLTGNYNFENIASALCLGRYFEVSDKDANNAVAAYAPGNMRSQIIEKGTNRIILDAYNANPSSMEAALGNLAAMKSENKVVILGDMYELGDEAEAEHRKLGVILSGMKLANVYLCGELIKSALKDFPSAHYFSTQEELMKFLGNHPIRNATVLVKASRGMKLEKTAEIL